MQQMKEKGKAIAHVSYMCKQALKYAGSGCPVTMTNESWKNNCEHTVTVLHSLGLPKKEI